MFHFTDKTGHDAIASQRDWLFRAAQPPAPAHSFGVYFTTLSPTTKKLARRLRIPRNKTTFFFEFIRDDKLLSLRGGRGSYVFFSPVDYTVERDRQIAHGPSSSRDGVRP